MYQEGDRVTVRYIRSGKKQPTIEPGTVIIAGKSGDLTIKLDIGEITKRHQGDRDLRPNKAEETMRADHPGPQFK
jgi:hypothetical protein